MVNAVPTVTDRSRGPGCALSFRRQRGFSLLEILVVMTVISVLAAFIIPALQATQLRTRQLKCMSNLRQIGIAMNLHLTEKKRYPLGSGANNFQAEIAPYLGLTVSNPATYRFDDRYRCAETLKKFRAGQADLWGYGYNETVVIDVAPTTPPFWPHINFGGFDCVKDAVNIPSPSKKMAMICNPGGDFWEPYAPWDLFTSGGSNPWLIYPYGIHDGRDNYLYCDGHVESIPTSQPGKINEGWWINAKGSPYQD
jgi:prepilin-type N-terminal cleavage/methylation domain-containing protein/prepilin-type processing-associated H-X9-DG protein